MSVTLIGDPQFPKIARIDYTDYWKDRGFAINKKLKEREEIMRAIIPNGSRVFDIGCGNSRLPIELKAKGCTVEVGDISPIVLDGFRAAGVAASVIDLADIEHAHIDGVYDYIILSEVLEHMTNPEEILMRLSPHTKHFLLTVPNTAFYPFRLRLLLGRFPKQWVYHPSEHVRFWSHTDFVNWIKAQGLTLERSIPSNGLTLKGTAPFLKDLWPNLFGHQIVYLCRP